MLDRSHILGGSPVISDMSRTSSSQSLRFSSLSTFLLKSRGLTSVSSVLFSASVSAFLTDYSLTVHGLHEPHRISRRIPEQFEDRNTFHFEAGCVDRATLCFDLSERCRNVPDAAIESLFGGILTDRSGDGCRDGNAHLAV